MLSKGTIDLKAAPFQYLIIHIIYNLSPFNSAVSLSRNYHNTSKILLFIIPYNRHINIIPL